MRELDLCEKPSAYSSLCVHVQKVDIHVCVLRCNLPKVHCSYHALDELRSILHTARGSATEFSVMTRVFLNYTIPTYSLYNSDCIAIATQAQRATADTNAKLQMLKQQQEAAVKALKAAEKALQKASKVQLLSLVAAILSIRIHLTLMICLPILWQHTLLRARTVQFEVFLQQLSHICDHLDAFWHYMPS